MSSIMYGNNSRYGGTMHPIGEYPRGQKPDIQVTAMISYPIVPKDVHLSRTGGAIGGVARIPYEGLVQLNMNAGDLVFVPRNRDTTNSFNGSAFAVWNGLPSYPTVMDFHTRFKAIGFAMDPYIMGADALAPPGIDVQAKGVANWVNSSGVIAEAGDPITWLPDTPEMNAFLDMALPNRARKIQRTAGTNVKKTLLVPLRCVVDRINPVDINGPEWVSIRGVAAEITAANTQAGVTEVLKDAMKKMFKLQVPLADMAIGWTPTPVKPDMIGQLVLY